MIAIKATAHKLARLVYAALTRGMAYVDRGMAAEEERYRQRALKHLAKRAAALGYSLSPASHETMSQNAVQSTVGGCVS